MKTMTIEEFCDKHGACSDGRNWAVTHCKSMKDAWDTARPGWVIWIATRPGVLKETDLIRFAVWSVRQVQHLLSDPRSLAALDTVDRYLAGTATKEEVDTAAYSAADAAAIAAARAAIAAAYAADAAAYAADTAAIAAARAADTAAYAARAADTAAYAARAARAADTAAIAAAYAEQAKWLRENTKPNFNE